MKKIAWLGVIGLSLSVSDAMAYATDPLIEGAKMCTRQLPHYEREYGIPTHLLSAIASTESGRYHEGLGIKVPWPWTINVEGKGYFFDTKQEAVAAVRKYKARGIQSIDVGCMQVNLYHHPQAFASLDEAFEPHANVAYAASFLRNLYQEEGSWKKAAADYHSKTPARGDEYVGVVYNSWYQILAKLRAAKAQTSDTALAANQQPVEPHIIKVNAPAQEISKHVRPLPEQMGKRLSAYRSPRMNSISLSKKDSRRENGIIVVRPETKTNVEADVTPAVFSDEQTLLASAQTAKPVEIVSPVEPKIIQVGAAHADSNSRKTGPTFIFND